VHDVTNIQSARMSKITNDGLTRLAQDALFIFISPQNGSI